MELSGGGSELRGGFPKWSSGEYFRGMERAKEVDFWTAKAFATCCGVNLAGGWDALSRNGPEESTGGGWGTGKALIFGQTRLLLLAMG